MSSSSSDALNSHDAATVLVVDDEPAVRDLASRWLRDEGFRCEQASRASIARERLEAGDIQVVTLDINMPEVSGLTLLPQIKQRNPDVEVIMLTALSETQCAIKALTQGAYGYLLKPVSREEFVRQVKKALERRELVLAKRDYTRNLERRVQEQTAMIRRAHEETIHRLITAAVCRDEETGAHIRRTGLFSSALAEAAGWSAADVECLRMAAPMHDIGKIGIPDAVLRKPGKLSAEEYEIMKMHAPLGAEMLADSESPVLEMARTIALCHHECWDGTGYPTGLAGEAIPECARIVAIVDVYDALTHDRVYRPALPEEEVLSIMRAGHGTHFDPLLLTLFFTLLPDLDRITRENPDRASGNGSELHGYALRWPSEQLSCLEAKSN